MSLMVSRTFMASDRCLTKLQKIHVPIMPLKNSSRNARSKF
jgi:hypothetical protein